MKYFGDPVDGVRYKVKDYGNRESRKICIDCNRQISVDETDAQTPPIKGSRKSMKSPATPPSTPEDGQIGFDLMSLSSRRGHFVDHVRKKNNFNFFFLDRGFFVLAMIFFIFDNRKLNFYTFLLKIFLKRKDSTRNRSPKNLLQSYLAW